MHKIENINYTVDSFDFAKGRHRVQMQQSDCCIFDVWRSLLAVNTKAINRLRDLLKDFDLSVNEYEVLFNVYTSPGYKVRIKDLRVCMPMTQSALSRLILRLVGRKYVTKSDCKSDGRCFVLDLTQDGLKVVSMAHQACNREIDQVFTSVFGAKDLDKLQCLCAKLECAIGSTCKSKVKTQK